MASGKLVLCGTPIGNLEDVTQRVLRALAEADVIACEDPGRTRKLLTHFGIPARQLVVYNEGNERRAAQTLLGRVRAGATVALVTDAGMPGLSDPGFRLTRACIQEELPVVALPGPTASVTALALSGLPPGRFVFEGFLPRRGGDRRRRIAELVSEPRTIVCYVSPHRLEETLVDLLEGLGDRPAALARELTKLYEEVRRGTLGELLAGIRADPARGEMVLVVGGSVGEHRPEIAPSELARRAEELMRDGVERREALGRVARAAGVPRRAVFDALLERRG
jgi:16S rRNA (cytidine1402-2'-O)-methyltransferase